MYILTIMVLKAKLFVHFTKWCFKWRTITPFVPLYQCENIISVNPAISHHLPQVCDLQKTHFSHFVSNYNKCTNTTNMYNCTFTRFTYAFVSYAFSYNTSLFFKYTWPNICLSVQFHSFIQFSFIFQSQKNVVVFLFSLKGN